MTREMKKLSRKNNGKRPQKNIKANKVEKTIQIVKETEFIQKDEFNNAEEPMPDVTLRDIKQKIKQQEKEARLEQEAAEDVRKRLLPLTVPHRQMKTKRMKKNLYKKISLCLRKKRKKRIL